MRAEIWICTKVWGGDSEPNFAFSLLMWASILKNHGFDVKVDPTTYIILDYTSKECIQVLVRIMKI